MRTVLFCIGSRANYASIKSAMQEANAHPALSIKVLLYSSALSTKYGDLKTMMLLDGFTVDYEISSLMQGDSPKDMAQSTGVALMKIPEVFGLLNPDFVVTVGDRYETIAVAIAAAYMNICLVHTMGGEITGSIDESVRHAVTKLAHVHFPANKEASEVICALGEDPKNIFITGCPRIDIARESQKLSISHLQSMVNSFGIGDEVNVREPFLMLSQHPVTTENEDSANQIEESLLAISQVGLNVLVFWPNSDSGSDLISQKIRLWAAQSHSFKKRLYRNLPPEIYLRLMSLTSCLVGNSSSGLREGAFLGTPVVNIGSRQSDREISHNVVQVDYSGSAILDGLKRQLTHGGYKSSDLYGDGTSGKKMAHLLSSIEKPSVQKKFVR